MQHASCASDLCADGGLTISIKKVVSLSGNIFLSGVPFPDHVVNIPVGGVARLRHLQRRRHGR